MKHLLNILEYAALVCAIVIFVVLMLAAIGACSAIVVWSYFKTLNLLK